MAGSRAGDVVRWPLHLPGGARHPGMGGRALPPNVTGDVDLRPPRRAGFRAPGDGRHRRSDGCAGVVAVWRGGGEHPGGVGVTGEWFDVGVGLDIAWCLSFATLRQREISKAAAPPNS